ncbi:MAG TPA: GNAT family N-acetyltransferase [Bryobacteraceae bacterium]|nr:GNAT family N-acetyltransferase [Bryobacteraceae bacterium]
MEIRDYTPNDEAGCLAICRSLDIKPDVGAFASYLAQPPDFYYVAEHDGVIVACGGFGLDRSGAELQWGMVGKQWQRQGLGRFLLFHRLREIGKKSNVEMVRLRAPVSESAFFAKQGFRETASQGAEVDMVKRLAVCS